MLAVIGPLPGPEKEAGYAYETLWNGARVIAHLPGDGSVRLLAQAGQDVTALWVAERHMTGRPQDQQQSSQPETRPPDQQKSLTPTYAQETASESTRTRSATSQLATLARRSSRAGLQLSCR
ncbi:hypothetical protein ABZ070_37040 [Streptomyces sp. NPDC006283]|uniref:hypothetical protein n=1 Tax=Streptomyces sp. NPDC006283 TaxID=3156741 RepID=UPI0033AF18D2